LIDNKNEVEVAIGDVHGCYNTLMDLMKILPKNSKHIYTGDLCDKGEYTKEVIQHVIDTNSLCVKGNHDYLMEKYSERFLSSGKTNLWTSSMYGGSKTLESYREDMSTLKKHVEFLSQLPYFLEKEKYFITHGFAIPYYKNREPKKIMSNRLGREFPDWEDFSNYDIINIFGHCDFKEPMINKQYIGIDTGCVYGRRLSAVELGTHKIYSVPFNPKDGLFNDENEYD